MDYSTQSSGAGSALAEAGEGIGEAGGSFFLDADAIPNADTLQPGATLTFVGRGEDGRLEFEAAGGEPPEEESMEDEMRRTTKPSPMGDMEGEV